jgi:hypothetical protein
MMKSDTVVKELIKEIPEIKYFYHRILEEWNDDELVIFQDVLNPYLIKLLEINEDRELISRIFNFLEKMATCNDSYLVEVILEFTVLERLSKDDTILAKSQEYMGKETKRVCNEAVFFNYNTVNKELIKEIPEIIPFYEKELEGWRGEEEEKYSIFKDILNPYLINLLEINENKELISRIFDFLEKIAISNYKKVQDALRYLAYDKTILAKSQKYIGKETKKISYKIEKVLGKIMVQREDVMELLINVCPSFEGKWKDHLEDIWDRDREEILYTDLSVFARHLTELTINKDFREFNDIFNEIERLIQEGDFFVSEAIVIGLLEDLQNGLLRNGYELNMMEKYLKPDTKECWIDLIKFWNP